MCNFFKSYTGNRGTYGVNQRLISQLHNYVAFEIPVENLNLVDNDNVEIIEDLVDEVKSGVDTIVEKINATAANVYTNIITKENESNTFDDNYSMFDFDQINDFQYKELSDILLSKAPNEDIRIKLESILYKGGYNGFSVNSNRCNKINPETERMKRIAFAKLILKNPETFDVLVKENVNLFHGTNGVALPSILKNGLNSESELQKSRIKLVTGENWSRVKNFSRNFVNFTDILSTATAYSRISNTSKKKNTSDLDFEVIIGTTVDEVNAAGIVDVATDKVEVGVKESMPLSGIKVIGVPSDKVNYVQKLIGDNSNITVVAIDGINDGLYSNCDCSFESSFYSDFEKLNKDLVTTPTNKTF